MLRTSFLGVVDRFNESLVAGEYFLKPIFPALDCAAEMENVSGGKSGTLEQRIAGLREACSPEVYAELLRLNSGDQKLVDLARTEVGRRFKLASQQGIR